MGRREALGLTREQVAEATRIPLAHVQAIEEGRFGDLPAGPYAEAWVRAIQVHLGLPPAIDWLSAVQPTPRETGQQGPPLWFVRGAAVVAVVALIATISYRALVTPSDAGASAVTAATDATDGDLALLLRARRNTRVRVVADGEVIADRQLAGGDEVEVRAEARVEVEVDSTDALRIEFNGERIVPQGRQDEPRRLVFMDDSGGAAR